MADTKKTSGTKDAEKQAEVDKLLANPNRQPEDDKRLDQLLHGKDPVVTGDVSVDPVGVDDGNGSGITDRASVRGETGGDDVHREVPNPNDEEAKAEPAPDATEAGASRAGSNETKAAGERQAQPKTTDKSGKNK